MHVGPTFIPGGELVFLEAKELHQEATKNKIKNVFIEILSNKINVSGYRWVSSIYNLYKTNAQIEKKSIFMRNKTFEISAILKSFRKLSQNDIRIDKLMYTDIIFVFTLDNNDFQQDLNILGIKQIAINGYNHDIIKHGLQC